MDFMGSLLRNLNMMSKMIENWMGAQFEIGLWIYRIFMKVIDGIWLLIIFDFFVNIFELHQSPLFQLQDLKYHLNLGNYLKI